MALRKTSRAALALSLVAASTSTSWAGPISSLGNKATLELQFSGALRIVSGDFLQPDANTPAHYENLGMRFIHLICDGTDTKVLASEVSGTGGTEYIVFSGQHCLEQNTKRVILKIGDQAEIFDINPG